MDEIKPAQPSIEVVVASARSQPSSGAVVSAGLVGDSVESGGRIATAHDDAGDGEDAPPSPPDRRRAQAVTAGLLLLFAAAVLAFAWNWTPPRGLEGLADGAVSTAVGFSLIAAVALALAAARRLARWLSVVFAVVAFCVGANALLLSVTVLFGSFDDIAWPGVIWGGAILALAALGVICRLIAWEAIRRLQEARRAYRMQMSRQR